MTYPVYIGDRAAGTMTVTAAGEDHLFEVICHPPEPGLWRVWVQGRRAAWPWDCWRAGVCAAGFPADHGQLGPSGGRGGGPAPRGTPPWRPAGPEDCPLPLPPGSLCRREGRRVRLAVPYDREGPFPLTELFCLARIGPWTEDAGRNTALGRVPGAPGEK